MHVGGGGDLCLGAMARSSSMGAWIKIMYPPRRPKSEQPGKVGVAGFPKAPHQAVSLFRFEDDYIAWKISSPNYNIADEFTPKDKALLLSGSDSPKRPEKLLCTPSSSKPGLVAHPLNPKP